MLEKGSKRKMDDSCRAGVQEVGKDVNKAFSLSMRRRPGLSGGERRSERYRSREQPWLSSSLLLAVAKHEIR